MSRYMEEPPRGRKAERRFTFQLSRLLFAPPIESASPINLLFFLFFIVFCSFDALTHSAPVPYRATTCAL